MILHKALQWQTQNMNKIELTKNTLYLALMGDQMCVF